MVYYDSIYHRYLKNYYLNGMILQFDLEKNNGHNYNPYYTNNKIGTNGIVRNRSVDFLTTFRIHSRRG